MTSESNAKTSRLNPFAFPSETSFRFALLMVSVIGVSMMIFNVLYNRLSGNWDHDQALQAECHIEANKRYPSTPYTWMQGGISNTEKIRVYDECIAPMDHSRAVWVVGGVMAILGMAWLFYWLYPAWIIKHKGLIPFDSADGQELIEYLEGLSREAELTHSPVFLSNYLNPTAGGKAFGHYGQRYVIINGGLVALFSQDLPLFRAVVLHELGHIYNADIDKTYFSVSLSVAFSLFAVAPFLLVLIFNPFSQATLGMSWRILMLIPLVFFTLMAVLRIREVYADLRASLWDGPKSALDRVLASLPRLDTRWPSYCHFHPSPAQRRQILINTDELFRLGYWEAFGTGIAASVAFKNVEYLLILLIPTDWEYLGAVGAGMIFAPLAVAILGTGVWRETFAAMMHGEPQRNSGYLGLSLGMGYILGQKLSLVDYAFMTSETALTDTDLLTFYVVQTGLILLSLFLFSHWIQAGASTWLEVAIERQSPTIIYWSGIFLAGALLVIWLGFFSYVVDDIRGTGINSIHQQVDIPAALTKALGISVPEKVPRFLAFSLLLIIVKLAHPVTLMIFISLWAFPFAAWFWRSRSPLISLSHWPLLDPPANFFSITSPLLLEPKLAIRIGLLSGIFFLLLMIAVSQNFVEAPASDRYEVYLYGLPFVASLIQAGAAFGVALKIRRLSVVHGLFAAFVGACVMSIDVLFVSAFCEGAILLKESGMVQSIPIISAFSEGLSVIPPEMYWITSSQIFNGGAFLAMSVALGTTATMQLLTN